MHRSYQPYTPVNNVFLQQRWDKAVFLSHRRKVHAAKSVIDNNPPKIHAHMTIKPKKMQVEATRLAVIERDNRLLLHKMEHILLSAGRIDCYNIYQKKSLNKVKRQMELVRIARENMSLLRRLEALGPVYNHKQWLFERKVQEKFLKNISRYPSNYSESGIFLPSLGSQHATSAAVPHYKSAVPADPSAIQKYVSVVRGQPPSQPSSTLPPIPGATQ